MTETIFNFSRENIYVNILFLVKLYAKTEKLYYLKLYALTLEISETFFTEPLIAKI